MFFKVHISIEKPKLYEPLLNNALYHLWPAKQLQFALTWILQSSVNNWMQVVLNVQARVT